jgi:hypothetical protein
LLYLFVIVPESDKSFTWDALRVTRVICRNTIASPVPLSARCSNLLNWFAISILMILLAGTVRFFLLQRSYGKNKI